MNKSWHLSAYNFIKNSVLRRTWTRTDGSSIQSIPFYTTQRMEENILNLRHGIVPKYNPSMSDLKVYIICYKNRTAILSSRFFREYIFDDSMENIMAGSVGVWEQSIPFVAQHLFDYILLCRHFKRRLNLFLNLHYAPSLEARRIVASWCQLSEKNIFDRWKKILPKWKRGKCSHIIMEPLNSK